MSKLREIATGLRFPEGPVALADGSVLVVEIEAARLTRIGPDGSKTTVSQHTGGPNGAAMGPDGKVYVCNNGGFNWHEVPNVGLIPTGQANDYSGGRIERVDLATGAIETLYTACAGFPLKGPNDIVFDAHGGFYFTDLGKSRPREIDRGAVYYAKADGSSIKPVAFPIHHAQRLRPLTRRKDALLCGDGVGAAVGDGHPGARRGEARGLAVGERRAVPRVARRLPALR